MKKIIIITTTICLAIFSLGILPAQAADAAAGSKIFTANCAACHAGGNNLVISTKNLRKETLEKYGMFSSDAIQAQVTNGKECHACLWWAAWKKNGDRECCRLCLTTS